MIKENLSLLPYKLQNKLSFLFNNLSDLENILFGINKIQINKPIFICGSPRSGTTLITHILNQHKVLGSFEYKDLPFYKIPIIWIAYLLNVSLKGWEDHNFLNFFSKIPKSKIMFTPLEI